LVDKVVGERREGTCEDVIVVDLPGGDEGVELRPTLYRFFEGWILVMFDTCWLKLRNDS
jgi:hypothetical protein